MDDLIDFINRNVWVIIIFFLAVFGIAYAISERLPEDFGEKSGARQIQIGELEDGARDTKENTGKEEAGSQAGEEDKSGTSDGEGKEGKEDGGVEPEPTPEPSPTPVPREKGVIYRNAKSGDKLVLRFAGDVNLADNYKIMRHASETEGGVLSCFGGKVKELMTEADLMMLNHEYASSNTGRAMPGKAYTFLGKEKNNAALAKLGVDIVSLANNHAYDYGKTAFLNTMKSLKKREIAYVGGGKNYAEASAPVYYNMNGVKIAIVSASRAEKNVMTPKAGKNSPGVMYTYDSAEFLKAIEKAEKNSDYVVAYVHWGTEYSTRLESAQTTQGHEYIDAGADVVIGSHTHCLQGMEYYKGKPIIYSLGNFLFNDKTLDTGILELCISTKGRRDTKILKNGKKAKYGGVKDKDVTVKFYPCIQSGCKVLQASGQDTQRILEDVNAISVNTGLTKTGVLNVRRSRDA